MCAVVVFAAANAGLPLRLDFGTASSPLAPGHERVTAADAFDGKKGRGWFDVAGLGKPRCGGLHERDRGSPDSLRRDFVAGMGCYSNEVKQGFAIGVPNGRYFVLLVTGDSQYGIAGRQPTTVIAEGKQIVDHIDVPVRRFATVSFETEVRDGRLDLVFDTAAGETWTVCALHVYPASTAADRARAKRSVKELKTSTEAEARRAIEHGFRRLEHVSTRTLPPALAGKPMVVFVPNPLERLYPNDAPRVDEAARKEVAAFAARGEYEPFTFAVYAGKRLEALSVEVGPLQGRRGSIAELDVRRIACRDLRHGSSWSTKFMHSPYLCAKAEPCDLPAGTTTQYWVTVRVPGDAPDGWYESKAVIRATGERASVLPLRLLVLPLALPEPEKKLCMYYDGRPFIRANLSMQLADMRAHGISGLTVTRATPKGTGDSLDLSEPADEIERYVEAGFPGPFVFSCGGYPRAARKLFPGLSWQEGCERMVRTVLVEAEKRNWPRIVFYPVDEIGNSEERRGKLRREAPVIQRAGGTVYVTANNFRHGLALDEFIDIWCVNIPITAEQEAQILEPERENEYWRYGVSFHRDSRQARVSSGYGFFQRPAAAHWYFHYQSVTGDPYEDLDGKNRDWCAAYPSLEGPLPTLDWEQIREGYDDLRWLTALERAAEAAKLAEKPALAREAEELLEEIRTEETLSLKASDVDIADAMEVLPEAERQGLSRPKLPERYVTNEEFVAYRRRVALLVLKLRARLGERALDHP